MLVKEAWNSILRCIVGTLVWYSPWPQVWEVKDSQAVCSTSDGCKARPLLALSVACRCSLLPSSLRSAWAGTSSLAPTPSRIPEGCCKPPFPDPGPAPTPPGTNQSGPVSKRAPTGGQSLLASTSPATEPYRSSLSHRRSTFQHSDAAPDACEGMRTGQPANTAHGLQPPAPWLCTGQHHAGSNAPAADHRRRKLTRAPCRGHGRRRPLLGRPGGKRGIPASAALGQRPPSRLQRPLGRRRGLASMSGSWVSAVGAIGSIMAVAAAQQAERRRSRNRCRSSGAAARLGAQAQSCSSRWAGAGKPRGRGGAPGLARAGVCACVGS